MTIKILITGHLGKMGRVTVQMVEAEKQFELVAKVAKGDDLRSLIQETQPQVGIDLTNPQSVYENALTMIECGVHPVIGSSGLSSDNIASLTQLCEQKKLGGIIAPNFSIGMVLAMRYTAQIARWFPDVEIIEMHHPQKQDAPSGTALKTAEMIVSEQKKTTVKTKVEAKTVSETIVKGSRGALYKGVPIHAVRLPGLVAHQSMLFGGEGESLKVHHDCFNRSAFMPGIKLACESVLSLKTLVYGLEHLLD